ncbi:type I secretion C-terminal target domain-containing protein, partial [Pseudomonadota bacterium]
SDTDGLDDIDSISVGGTTFVKNVDYTNDFSVLVGETIDVGYGTVTLTGYAAGTFDYSYTLDQTVDNDTQAGADDLGYDESFDVAVSDGTASATDTVTIHIVDDEPSAIDPAMTFVTNNIGQTATGIPLDLDTNIDNNVGADQTGTLSFANIGVNGTDSGKETGGAPIHVYTNGTILIGSTLIGSTYAAVLADAGAQVFTITLNLDGSYGSSSDTYSFELHQQIDGGITTFNVSDVGFDFVGGNDPYAYFDDTITTDANGDQDVLLTPVDGTTVNTNANEGGISGGNSVGAGEAMRVDYVHGISGDSSASPGTQHYSDPGNDDHTFTGHNTVNGASALFTQIHGTSDVKIRAYDNDDSVPNTVNDYGALTADNINKVTIRYNGATGTALEGAASLLVGGTTFTFDWTGDDLVVGGVVQDTEIAVYTGDGLTTVEYEHDSGSTFKIGGFGADVPTPGHMIDLHYDLALTDADGDSVIMEDGIQVQLSPEDHVLITGTDGDDVGLSAPGQSATIIALDGDDELLGNGGNDILIGGAGDDTMTGGGGVDTFDFNQGDEGTSGSPAVDTITDFTAGDKLDLSDMLVGEEAGDINNYLDMNFVGGNTVIDVTHDPDSASGVTQQIVLEGVDLSAGSTVTIDDLVANGTIVVDMP